MIQEQKTWLAWIINLQALTKRNGLHSQHLEEMAESLFSLERKSFYSFSLSLNWKSVRRTGSWGCDTVQIRYKWRSSVHKKEGRVAEYKLIYWWLEKVINALESLVENEGDKGALTVGDERRPEQRRWDKTKEERQKHEERIKMKDVKKGNETREDQKRGNERKWEETWSCDLKRGDERKTRGHVRLERRQDETWGDKTRCEESFGQ